MKKILWLSDSTTTVTGYANQTMNILNRLSTDYECHQLAHNYIGQDIKPGLEFKDGTKLNYWLHGNGLKPYGQDIMTHRIRELKIDIFGILLDTFMLYPWLIDTDLSPAKTFFYFPTDGENAMPLGCDKILQKVHFPICMSKFGQQQVWNKYKIKCDHIPHGVDKHQFYPLNDEERKKLRQEKIVYLLNGNQMLPIKGVLADKFVIGVVARNQGRKMLDRTFKTMGILRDVLPNAVLYLHIDPYDAAGTFNIPQLIEDYRLHGKVFFSGMSFFRGFEHKEMNDVYNVMDCFFLSTSGEGFGIPIIEAMSAGVPVVATDYTTTKELVTDNNAGIAVPMDTTVLGSWNVERGIMKIESAADAIVKLANDEKLREELGANGRKAVLEQYDWEVLIPKWREFLKKIEDA
jgi:glycosyltransferase involved in cell wall biosynthesis